MAAPYHAEIEFAFFAANFGYSKRDYLELTDLDKQFLYKAWENRTVAAGTHIRDAVLNALTNSFRKKGKRFIKLWKKRPKKADMEKIQQNFDTIKEIEKREAGWIDRIYKANGLKRPVKKKSGEQ